MLIPRSIQPRIEASLFKGKIIILYGARQVGKTTLVRQIAASHPDSTYLNCDEPDINRALSNKTSTELMRFIGANKLVILDEAQRVQNIGLSLKLIIDSHPEYQIIATGSSSFDLAGKVNEPLTGRKLVFELFPLSFRELLAQRSKLEIERLLPGMLVTGLYPEVVCGSNDPQASLREITQSYLYKDLFTFGGINNPEVLWNLLRALALQIGNEVSFNELGTLVGLDKQTVEKYIRVLENAFVIFRLPPFHNNPRKEIGKKRKIYFIDNGIRNALINNFNPPDLRTDTGRLWENFLLAERMKRNASTGAVVDMHFWRTYDGSEVDYIESSSGLLQAFEIKWSDHPKYRAPARFRDLYPDVAVSLIHKDNFWDFV